MKAILRLENQKEQTEYTIKVNQALTFGRNPDANCQVIDEKMSGTHCRFILKPDRLEIRDLDSKNGTYLNGIRIEQSEVFLGDEIKAGNTVISLLDKKMDSESVEKLTFPGAHKDRISYELKADFTGARIQNQSYNKEHPGEPSAIFQAKEIYLRKKARSNIRLSKQEIKSRHKVLTMLAMVIDIALLIAIISVPIYLLNSAIRTGGFSFFSGEALRAQKVSIIIFGELIAIVGYLALNMRLLKYSVGEKLTGIEDLHTKQ